MKNLKNKYFVGALAICSMGFTACSDDDTYDFPGDASNRVYTADCSGQYAVVQTPVGAIGAMEAKIPAQCNHKAAADIKVKMSVDNSLIDAYNEENETNYLPLPENVYTIENAIMTIPAGEMASADTTKVVLTADADLLATVNDLNGYIVPIVMESVQGGGAVKANSVKSISYLTIKVTEEVLDKDATKENRKGSLVSDRSGWTVYGINGTEIGTDWYGNPQGEPANWFDGTDDYCGFSVESGTATVVVDLGRVYNVDGICGSYKYYGYYTYGTFSDGTIVSYSSDATNWIECAQITSSSWSGVDFFGFYGPLPMRYVKIATPGSEWSGGEISCGDFNVYATN